MDYACLEKILQGLEKLHSSLTSIKRLKTLVFIHNLYFFLVFQLEPS